MSRVSPPGTARPRRAEVTYLTPPRSTSFPAVRAQLEFSSRSLVFPDDGSRVLRVWGPSDAPYVVGVRESGARWEVTGYGVDPPTARDAVRALFSLDHDVEAFYRLARRERVLAGAARRFRGLRLPRDAHLYEALVHAIIGQQLSVRAAHAIKARLFASVGSFEEADGVAVPRVPSPREVAALGVDGLRKVGLSGVKSRSILALAGREREGALDGDAFRSAPVETAVERLDAEPGVGRWTAENALLRGVGRTDLFIAGDLGVRAALAAYGVLPRTAPERDARRWADRWYPGWGSYATLYLWRRWTTEGSPPDAPRGVPSGKRAMT
ncbi:MAG: DNA-3-methyladenine glycosylase family protein [Thermoplasmata archaeon]